MKDTGALDLDGILDSMENADEGSFFLFHTCAHNPTGVDPTREQWKVILRKAKAKRHLCFFDTAYLGFSSGDVDTDAYPLRMAAILGCDVAVALSFSKNMGLYGERVGCLMLLTEGQDEVRQDRRRSLWDCSWAVFKPAMQRCLHCDTAADGP